MRAIIEDNPLVSIIVPAYNAGGFLHLTIDSVRQQTYSNWELVIVNDGSKDNTRLVAEAYAAEDKRVRVVSQENQGVTVSRRKGLEAASGSWVFFLDADDLITENALEVLLNQPDDASIVFGATLYARSRNEVFGRQSVVINGLGVNSLYPLIFSFRMPQAIWGKLIRKEVANQIVWPDERIKIGEDALALFSILPLCSKIYAVTDDSYYYIQHEDSCMAQKSPSAVASMRLYLSQIHDMVSQLSPELRLLGYRYVLMEYYAYLIYGGEWDRGFVMSCDPHAELPVKTGLLIGAYQGSLWLGNQVRSLLRVVASCKRTMSAKIYLIGGWFSGL